MPPTRVLSKMWMCVSMRGNGEAAAARSRAASAAGTACAVNAALAASGKTPNALTNSLRFIRASSNQMNVLSALIGDAACHRAGSRLRMLALPSEKVKAIGPRHDLTLLLTQRMSCNTFHVGTRFRKSLTHCQFYEYSVVSVY